MNKKSNSIKRKDLNMLLDCFYLVDLFVFLFFLLFLGNYYDNYDNDNYSKYYQQPDEDTESKRLRAEVTKWAGLLVGIIRIVVGGFVSNMAFALVDVISAEGNNL